jgi:F-type H+-transporting ATPase subunit alpha
LARGARLTEVLKQQQFQPIAIEEQVVAIFAGVRGYLDSIKVEDVTRFEESLIDEMRARGADILEAIRTEEEISKATEDKLAKFLGHFVKTFA